MACIEIFSFKKWLHDNSTILLQKLFHTADFVSAEVRLFWFWNDFEWDFFNIFVQNFTNMPQTLKNIENSGEIVLYQPDDSLSLEVKLENETVWLSQQQMATLFDTTKQNISLHINNIFKEGELNKDSGGCPKSPQPAILSKEVSKKMILPCFFKQKNLVILK